MENDLLELLYNQKDVCEQFTSQGLSAALELIKSKEEKIASLSGTRTPLHLRTFLNSLNKCLYHYVLFQRSPSPSNCCYHNFQYVHANLSQGTFLDAARQILLNYEEYLRPVSIQNKHIQEACRFIQEHLDEELSLERVASHIYVSRCHLCQLFRTCKKINFSEYVTMERIALAKTLLVYEKYSIDLVAERCGFSSSSYFSTVFKKKVGMSPREFRKQQAAIE